MPCGTAATVDGRSARTTTAAPTDSSTAAAAGATDTPAAMPVGAPVRGHVRITVQAPVPARVNPAAVIVVVTIPDTAIDARGDVPLAPLTEIDVDSATTPWTGDPLDTTGDLAGDIRVIDQGATHGVTTPVVVVTDVAPDGSSAAEPAQTGRGGLPAPEDDAQATSSDSSTASPGSGTSSGASESTSAIVGPDSGPQCSLHRPPTRPGIAGSGPRPHSAAHAGRFFRVDRDDSLSDGNRPGPLSPQLPLQLPFPPVLPAPLPAPSPACPGGSPVASGQAAGGHAYPGDWDGTFGVLHRGPATAVARASARPVFGPAGMVVRSADDPGFSPG